MGEMFRFLGPRCHSRHCKPGTTKHEVFKIPTKSPQLGRGKAARPDQIVGRLRAGLLRLDDRFGGRWRQCYGEPFDIVATPPPGAGSEGRWRIDLAAGTVTAAACGNDASAWDMVGPAVAWERVLSGDVDLSVALRRCELRYCDSGATGPVEATTRMDMVADLLGLASWPPAGNAPEMASEKGTYAPCTP